MRALKRAQRERRSQIARELAAGICFETRASANALFLKNGIHLIAQSTQRHTLPKELWCPSWDLGRASEKKRSSKVLLSPSITGHPFVPSRTVPADRVAALQEAFSASLRDTQLLAEADRLHLPVIGSKTSQEAAAYIAEMYDVGSENISAARKISE
jgi:hypothetical protein